MSVIYTTREAGDLFGVAEWRVRRLYEDGTLPEPPRFAGKRAISREHLADVVIALRARGWLRDERAEAAAHA